MRLLDYYLFINRMLFIASIIRFSESYADTIPRKSEITVTPVTPPMVLGEGPYWSFETQQLYFVDILDQKIYCLNANSNQPVSASICKGPVSFIIGVENTVDHFIIGCGRNMTLVKWNGVDDKAKAIRTLTSVDTDRSDTRFNDAKVDTVGRFWGGTMGPEINSQVTMYRGALYTVDDSLKPQKKLSPVSVSNGIAWNIDDDIMYYIDSPTRKVIAFQYDARNGTISNPRTVFDFNDFNLTGVPDGMTMDTDDNLWIASHGGGMVLNVSPQGTLLRTINIPAKKVTSVTFGGQLLNILYVTTASVALTEQEKQSNPNSGSVFAVTGLGVRGIVPNKFKLNI